MNKDRKQGIIAILIANTIFGLNIPVTKQIVAEWMSPMGYTTTRMVLGAIIFWIISVFQNKDSVKGKDLIIIFIGGLIGSLGTQFLFSKALEYTTPVVFSLIMALTPVVVLLMSAIFLKEVIPVRKALGILISISGAAMIILVSGSSDHQGSNNVLGIVVALFCVLCYGGYMMLTRNVSMKYKPVTVAKWMFFISAIVAFPLSYQELPEQRMFSAEANFEAYSLMAFAIVFSTTLAFFLMPVALKRLEANTVSIFMNIQPIVALVVGQDVFSWDKPVAVLLVVTGVYLVTVQKKKAMHEISE
ncbi:DMT family transporter [Fulvivirga maritima]|uniref:DMT family transporter n=1 Tax=Fulvivirga maritima TaxID=2904247 RepID=UPI001F22E738|nr:DMT family transporter [Fulvivirga maritima]UII25739.1 DMT family transporter [Fulvivirga maritima]